MKYFESLPKIVYDGYTVTNILTRVKMADINSDQMAFLPYKDTEGTFYSSDTYTYSSNPDKSSWIPIYSYTREDEDNEKKKVIKLLDKRYAQLAEKNLLAALNE